MVKRRKTKLERLLSFNQHKKRFGAKAVQNELTDIDALKEKIISDEELTYTHGSDKNVQIHIKALRSEFSDQPELLYYHARLIVLIRREANLKKNLRLFEQLWENEIDFLLKHLNTRWIVSAADTFVDYSDDPLAKTIAMNVITFVNTIKLVETERYLQVNELNKDSTERLELLQTSRVSLPDGMSGFAVGTDDTLRNMRWRLEEVSQLHPLGSMLMEVFNRAQNYDSVYKRFKNRHTRKKTAWWDE